MGKGGGRSFFYIYYLAMFLRSYNIHRASSGSVKISEEGKSYISRPEPTYCKKT